MSELIEKLEKAAGAERLLDGEIFKAAYPERDWVLFEDGWCSRCLLEDGCAFDTAPRYTASIDAALTLVPEGYGWRIEAVGNGPSRAIVGGSIHKPWLDCATPALAICIAALKARTDA